MLGPVQVLVVGVPDDEGARAVIRVAGHHPR